MIHNDELIDIVNEHDEVIESAWRSQSSNKKYVRCVIAFLRSSDNKFCLMRRTAHKEFMPSHMALPGGCVQSSESYEIAFRREILEEINIDVEHYQFRPLGLIKPWENHNNPHCFKMVYEIIVPEQHFEMNEQDFSELEWFEIHDFFSNRWEHDKIAPDIPKMIKQFYAHLINE